MSLEVLDIVKEINVNSPATQLALQCAPVISGLKVSNLLTIRNESVHELKETLNSSQLSSYLLYANEEKSTFLIYRRHEFELYLAQQEVISFLKRSEYVTKSLKQILQTLQYRFTKCRGGEMEFPHEIGVILGYPMEDVEGFIENEGKDFLCTGYWKVYYDMPRKQELFQKFEAEKETMIRLMACGIKMKDIMCIYSNV